MPFKSDKQRRYLWSQKPEVARQIAYKQDGGGVYDLHDDAAGWWNKRMAGVPQHRGYIDDPDDITETYTTNPDDPHGGRNLNPNIPIPAGYTDMATYYTPGMRQLGVGADQRMKMKRNNAELAQKAAGMNFQFNDGGAVPPMPAPKKVTQKDRYGNQVTLEYESDVKPLDITKLMEKSIDAQVPEIPQVPYMQVGGDVSFGGGGHPGQPMGSDTVPAWLTPGEFVVNKEAMDDPANAAMVKAINDEGRVIQNMNRGGGVDDAQDFAGPESLTPEQIQMRMQAMRAASPGDGPMSMPVPPPWAGRPEGYSDLLHDREGFRDDIYIDTRGFPTVGYGHKLPDEYAAQEGQRPFAQQQLDDWFEEDSARGVEDAIKNVGRERWTELDEAQKSALASMAFQLGGEGQAKFKNMLDAVKRGDNEAVRREAEDSLWFDQTPKRVQDLQAAFMYGGGPVYAYRGYDVAEQDAMDIEDPMADLSGGWTPPVYDMDTISPMEQAILDAEAPTEPMAMPDEATGEAPDDMSSIWGDIAAWVGDTSVADKRNAGFNLKATENNKKAVEETVAEMEARIAAGEPVNELTLQGAQAALEHQNDEVEAAITTAVATGAMSADEAWTLAQQKGIDEANALLDQKPGSDDDKTRLEDLANSEEFEDEDDPSKESDNGTQSQSEVIAQGEEAAKQDPSAVAKAQGFFKDAFSDLFDGKELARMGIMYLGSRALGYSHGGSLNWAAKQYINRVDAKQAGIQTNAAAFAKSGKFTPESVAAYQKSGDLSALSAIKENPTTTGNVMNRTVGGQRVAFQEVKMADGSVRYTDPNGRSYTAAQLENATAPYEAAFEKGTPEYRSRRSRATGDAAGRFEEVWKAEDRFRVGDNEWKTTTKIRPKQAADEFWGWAERNNIDPESDEALNIMTNAYQQAIADGKGGKITPTKLTPYLEQEKIREETGAPELFMTNQKEVTAGKAAPSYVRGDKMALLNDNIDMIIRNSPREGITRNSVYQLAISKWGELDPEEQKLWNSKATDGESGFYKYLNQELAKLAQQM